MTHFNHLLGCQPQKSDLVGVGCNLDSGIFFLRLHALCSMPDLSSGIEPVPPTLGVRSLNHWITREVPWSCLTLPR